MSVTIRIFGKIATVSNYKWHCDDPRTLDLLQVTINPWGPSGADPNPDLTVAKEAMSLYREGEIIAQDKKNWETDGIY